MDAKKKALTICQDIGMTSFGSDFNEGSTLPLDITKKIAVIMVNEIQIALRDQYNKHFSLEYQEEIGYWCNTDECKYWFDVSKSIQVL